MLTRELYRHCVLCPRKCGVDRLRGEKGVCGETAQLRIASIAAHFGEEPPITGTRGSGTVFFTGCSLRCSFCQNFQISCLNQGETATVERVADEIEILYRERGIHNVNFVTPDHFAPHTAEIVIELRRRNVTIPVIYNTSGYMRADTVSQLEPLADIYMPDFKYACGELAGSLSGCRDYPEVALDALTEMVSQKGFLNSFMGQSRAATRGVFARHLVLPGHIDNSVETLSLLYNEFGSDLPISLMSQYWPVFGINDPEMNRRLTAEEFYRVYDHAMDLGFRNMFVQHISGGDRTDRDFLPDFDRDVPFPGNEGKM